MKTIRDRALVALEFALGEATLDGLRDLHEAVQTLHFAMAEGKATLLTKSWGNLSTGPWPENATACPLAALFIREARRMGVGVEILTQDRMARQGFTPPDFYAAWDSGLLSCREIRLRVERHLEDRIDRSRDAG